jgi:hypothetical protein
MVKILFQVKNPKYQLFTPFKHLQFESFLAARECGMPLVVLAQKFRLSSTAVSNSVKRGKKVAAEKNLQNKSCSI